ncbi:hypothetical protein ACWFMJ_22050 [Bacillus subtilis]
MERVNRQDAGLAAPGHGWPVAAARGIGPECGHAEPRRGTEWWGMYGTTTWVTKKCLHIGDTLIET